MPSSLDASNSSVAHDGGASDSGSRANVASAYRPSKPACESWSDSELVFAAEGTRAAAFAELFGRHSASVAAVARMVLGADSACDDVVAEVFTALWRSPEKFDPRRGSLLGFLRLRARGRSIDFLRSESSRHRREDNDGRDRREFPEIGDELIAIEDIERLRRAVTLLPEDERIAIELAYFSGMSYRAVGSHLAVPEGTIKSRIRRGLQRLREQGDIDEGNEARCIAREGRERAASPTGKG